MRCASGAGKASQSGPGRARRQAVEHHADPLGIREIDPGELTHAGGEVHRGAPLRDPDPAPGPMHVEDYEQVRRPAAAVLVVIARHLPGLGRQRLARLADELGRALVEAHHRPLRVGGSA